MSINETNDENEFHKNYEPLPFTDYSLFKEEFDANQLRLNLNPYSFKKIAFIPKESIKLAITAELKSPLSYHYIYTIHLEHNNIKWKISRTYADFRQIHKKLSKLAKAAYGIACHNIPKDKIRKDWPLFPLKQDILFNETNIEQRCTSLRFYLERICKFPPYREHPCVLSFLSVSCITFVTDLSPSLIEAQLYQRIAKQSNTCSLLYCKTFQLCYENRWFCLKDTYLLNLNAKANNSIGFVMLVDQAFTCKKITRLNLFYGIKIVNLQRTIYIKCKSYQQQLDWYEKINLMLQEVPGKLFKEQTNYLSFAPVRTNQLCRWFLNASAYMENVMYAINHAREEIYIADWWLCPELFLKRPTDDVQYRLDKILLKKAKEGVKIYILLYKEIAIVHDLMSLRTKHVLTEYGKNQNIKVLRHPEHFIDGVFLWSHHEKCVIIDQSVAFTGGIDLCFGRWDDDLHRLVSIFIFQANS